MPRKKITKEVDINDTEIKKELDRGNRNLLITGIILFALGILALIIYIGVIFIAIGVYVLYLYWERSTDINKNPVIKKIPDEDKNIYIKLLDDELKSIKDKSGTCFTDSFIIVKSTFGIKWIHYSKIAWVYQRVTKHSVNFIPTGTTRAICICGSNTVLTVDYGNDENKVTETMKFLTTIAPFAVFGYSKDTLNYWNKNGYDFLTKVNQRERIFFDNPAASSVKWVKKIKDISKT